MVRCPRDSCLLQATYRSWGSLLRLGEALTLGSLDTASVGQLPVEGFFGMFSGGAPLSITGQREMLAWNVVTDEGISQGALELGWLFRVVPNRSQGTAHAFDSCTTLSLAVVVPWAGSNSQWKL